MWLRVWVAARLFDVIWVVILLLFELLVRRLLLEAPPLVVFPAVACVADCWNRQKVVGCINIQSGTQRRYWTGKRWWWILWCLKKFSWVSSRFFVLTVNSHPCHPSSRDPSYQHHSQKPTPMCRCSHAQAMSLKSHCLLSSKCCYLMVVLKRFQNLLDDSNRSPLEVFNEKTNKHEVFALRFRDNSG